MTSELKRLSYARICIEIGIDDSLPNALDIELDDGSSLEIQIEYNWVPKRCLSCKEFGHLTKNCKKFKHQDWIPKVLPQPATTSTMDGEWKQVKRNGKEIMVDLSPPPNGHSVGMDHNKANCSTSNVFDLLPTEEDIVGEEKGLPLPLDATDGSEPQDSTKMKPPLDDSLDDVAVFSSPTKGKETSLEQPDISTPSSDCASLPLLNPLIQKLTMIDELEKKNKKTLKRRENRKKKEGSRDTPGSSSS